VEDEKEQIENMRAWWSDNGNYVIAGVVLGAALLFGLNYYSTNKANAEIAASALYDTLADHVAEGRLDAAEETIAELNAAHADSAYAHQAKLAMARLYMDSNRDEDAANLLRELEGDSESAFASLARLRLAKILQYQEKHDDVLALLEGQEGSGFTARYAEARGDALTNLDRFDEARAEYLVALADNGQTVDATFLQLKILDLPVPETNDVADDALPGLDSAADTAESELPGVDDAAQVADSEPEAGDPADTGVADASEPETP